MDRFNHKNTVDRLTRLPEYIRVGAFVSFSEDISMHDLLQFRWELVKDNPHNFLTQTAYCWTAIRCYEDSEENYHLPHCGLGTGGYVYTQEMNLTYPNFDGTQYPGDMSQGISVDSPELARIYENQFTSHLSYMRDMCLEDRGIGDISFYENALTYIDENGILVYGCYIVCSPQSLLEIMEKPNVSRVFIGDYGLDV